MKTTLLFAPFIGILLMSCEKKEVKTSPVEFYLMDIPAGYDAVNIHIKKIEAKIISDSTRWVALQTRDTTVDLFHFQDSTSLMMAKDVVPFGLLKEIRFVLGDDNSVVVNGVSHPLVMPVTALPQMLIGIDRKLNEAFNGFILDFDASQSIIEDSGTYRLQPVVRLLQ
jgi:hypothetical protein